MTSHLPAGAALALWSTLACVLLNALPTEVVHAESPENVSDSAAELDTETPVRPSAANPKSRYAGWLLGAYLVPPVVVGLGFAARSGRTVLAGAALMWLAPLAVHFIAGEYALGGRTALIIACAAGGMIIGALIGLAIGALSPQDPNASEDGPDFQRLGGLVFGGLIGSALGALTWAVIDVTDAFKRDAKRRERASQTLAFSVRPERGGLSIGVHGAF